MIRIDLSTIAMLVLLAAVVQPERVAAEAALAVGLPANVADSGFAYGVAVNARSKKLAGAEAMTDCRKPGRPDQAARDRCVIVNLFRNMCMAVAMDPKDGTPGVGWSVAARKPTAEKRALAKCSATAGAERASACQIDWSGCDGGAR